MSLFLGTFPFYAPEGNVKERSVLLLDLEGENGTVPLTLKEDAKIFRVG